MVNLVREHLGIALGEMFNIEGMDGDYFFNGKGNLDVYYVGDWKCESRNTDKALGLIVRCPDKVKLKPFKPFKGTKYWYLDKNSLGHWVALEDTWNDRGIDIMRAKAGCVFPNSKRAIQSIFTFTENFD